MHLRRRNPVVKIQSCVKGIVSIIQDVLRGHKQIKKYERMSSDTSSYNASNVPLSTASTEHNAWKVVDPIVVIALIIACAVIILAVCMVAGYFFWKIRKRLTSSEPKLLTFHPTEEGSNMAPYCCKGFSNGAYVNDDVGRGTRKWFGRGCRMTQSLNGGIPTGDPQKKPCVIRRRESPPSEATGNDSDLKRIVLVHASADGEVETRAKENGGTVGKLSDRAESASDVYESLSGSEEHSMVQHKDHKEGNHQGNKQHSRGEKTHSIRNYKQNSAKCPITTAQNDHVTESPLTSGENSYEELPMPREYENAEFPSEQNRHPHSHHSTHHPHLHNVHIHHHHHHTHGRSRGYSVGSEFHEESPYENLPPPGSLSVEEYLEPVKLTGHLGEQRHESEPMLSSVGVLGDNCDVTRDCDVTINIRDTQGIHSTYSSRTLSTDTTDFSEDGPEKVLGMHPSVNHISMSQLSVDIRSCPDTPLFTRPSVPGVPHSGGYDYPKTHVPAAYFCSESMLHYAVRPDPKPKHQPERTIEEDHELLYNAEGADCDADKEYMNLTEKETNKIVSDCGSEESDEGDEEEMTEIQEEDEDEISLRRKHLQHLTGPPSIDSSWEMRTSF